MKRISPFVRGLALIALVALLILVLHLQTSLSTASTLARFGFYVALGLGGYLLWRDFGRREISTWPQRVAGVFYGALGLGLVDIGWYLWPERGYALSGPNLLAFLVVLAVSITVAIRTWVAQHRYS